jgi:hypothetical protein
MMALNLMRSYSASLPGWDSKPGVTGEGLKEPKERSANITGPSLFTSRRLADISKPVCADALRSRDRSGVLNVLPSNE